MSGVVGEAVDGDRGGLVCGVAEGDVAGLAGCLGHRDGAAQGSNLLGVLASAKQRSYLGGQHGQADGGHARQGVEQRPLVVRGQGVCELAFKIGDLRVEQADLGKGEPEAGRRSVAMPTAVVEVLEAHLLEFPVTHRDGLISPAVTAASSRQVRSTAFPPGASAAEGALPQGGVRLHEGRRTHRQTGPSLARPKADRCHARGLGRCHRARDAVPTRSQHPEHGVVPQGATAERDRGIADRLQAQVEAAQAANAT